MAACMEAAMVASAADGSLDEWMVDAWGQTRGVARPTGAAVRTVSAHTPMLMAALREPAETGMASRVTSCSGRTDGGAVRDWWVRPPTPIVSVVLSTERVLGRPLRW